MASRLTGAMYTYQTHVLYVGALLPSARHSHHAGQVIWAPGGLFIEDEARQQRRVTTHVVPPHRHHGHGASDAVAILWVDRDDLRWDRALEPPPDVSRDFPSSACEQLAPEEARDIARMLLDWVAPAQGSPAYAPRHPAVVRMCALLDSAAPEREIGVTALAAQSGLSVRQLRHCFTEELGLNPQAYLRWRRLRRAFLAIERGATLTEAAVEGGFADGAHFSRVFQAQFGMAPSLALSSVRFAGPLA
jgi:AraC-like DNA-binding protein